MNQVYDADRLVRSECGGPMRIAAFIDQAAIIEMILTHLGQWPGPSHTPLKSLRLWS